MQICFTLLAIFGLGYFALAKRRFDLFSVAFISACVYFLPGFFGFVPDGAHSTHRLDILPETYGVMVVVLTGILLGALVHDHWRRDTENADIDETFDITKGSITAHVALWLGIVGFVMTVHDSGSLLLSADKRMMAESLTRWAYAWVFGASLAAAIAFLHGKWFVAAAALVLLMINVFVGYRSGCAMTVIAVLLLAVSAGGVQRAALRQRRLVVVGTLSAAFFFLYKMIYRAVKLGDFETVRDRFGDPEFYFGAVIHSEPFGVQAVLNEIIRSDFRTGYGYIAEGLLGQLVIFHERFGLEYVAFTDLFQPRLFPEAEQGMGDNIWAQMFAAGGWMFLIAFVVFFVITLGVGSKLLRCRNLTTRAAIALGFAYWVFFIHRNDIVYELILVKRVFIVWAMCMIVSGAVSYLSRSSGMARKSSLPVCSGNPPRRIGSRAP